jgi:hypothetical protein
MGVQVDQKVLQRGVTGAGYGPVHASIGDQATQTLFGNALTQSLI